MTNTTPAKKNRYRRAAAAHNMVVYFDLCLVLRGPVIQMKRAVEKETETYFASKPTATMPYQFKTLVKMLDTKRKFRSETAKVTPTQ